MENSETDGNSRPPDCLLRNLHAGHEATVTTGHGTTDWFQIGKGVHQGCTVRFKEYSLTQDSLMSSTVKAVIPCLFNLHAEYIMRNAGLEEAQAGIKIAGRNINNLRHADDTTFMAESEVQWTPRCPDSKEGWVSLQRLKCRLIFHLTR